MDAVYAIIKITDDKQTNMALFPNLSIAAPINGELIAEMIYGTPKRKPEVTLSKPYFEILK